MKPLRETAHPVIDALLSLVFVAAFISAICSAICAALVCVIGDDTIRNHFHRDVVTPMIVCLVIAIPAFIIPPFCKHFIIEKEFGTFRGADYARYYYITQTCVLPHAIIHQRPDSNFYSINIRLRYQYDEILHAYQEMKKRHRVYYNFPRYNIPATTCQIQMAISRHTAKRLLTEMRTFTGGPNNTFVILETSVDGYGDCELPAKMQFISRRDLKVLQHQLLAAPDHLATAAIDVGITTRMDERFLDFCDTLIYTDEQLINLPSVNWTSAMYSG